MKENGGYYAEDKENGRRVGGIDHDGDRAGDAHCTYPQMQDSETGTFQVSYLVIGIMAITIVALFLLGRLPKQVIPQMEGKLLMPVSILGMLVGSILLISSLFDAWSWLMPPHATPAPNTEIISAMDGIVLFLTLLFGVLGGIFFVRLGLLWAGENCTQTRFYRVWALTPVLWIWMRLARYEMSYASAVDVSQSFYDFVMMICTLLFFFAFARYVSRVGENPPRFLLVYALSAGFFSITGTITRMAMYMMGETSAYSASQLASTVDFVIGLFAFGFAFLLMFGKEFTMSDDPSDTPEETAPHIEKESNTESPKANDILSGL